MTLRLAAVYGPRLKGNYARLFRAIRSGRFVRIGSGRNRRTLVYVDDVARAAIAATTCPQVSAPAINITDGTVHTLADIAAAISRAVRKPLPSVTIPVPLAVAAASAIEYTVGRRLRFRPRAALEKYFEDVAVSGELATAVLGFRATVGLDAGWQIVAQALA